MSEPCFACAAPATTVEHVPPRCLFPNYKDAAEGEDLRQQLITVPACADHNLGKAADDEYFLWVLSINVCANQIGQRQALTKLVRAHRRRPALGKTILDGGEDVTVVDSHTGTPHEATQTPLDGARFKRTLDLITLGIYRHHFGARWIGDVRVHADFIDFPDAESRSDVNANRRLLFDGARAVFDGEPTYGANPSVFRYQVRETPERRGSLIRLAFFGGCTATAFLGLTDGRRNR